MALKNTHYGAMRIAEILQSCRSLFFIGIGGISMSSLAQISLKEGFLVGGSDRTQNSHVDQLASIGACVHIGHAANNIEGYDAVIYTVAIGEDNPEYVAAISRGLPVISRADYLGYLMMRYRRRIGIAGMHGKSTCTAMCAHILLAAADPTVLCGAELSDLGGATCRIGDEREHFVFEACEYMDSFLDFSPTLAVILNIDLDHVDYFKSIEQVRASFLKYAERTGEGGRVLYNADDAESVSAMRDFSGTALTFGIEREADYQARNIHINGRSSTFDLYCKDLFLCTISLPVPGMHSVYNALAASASAILCGIAPDVVAGALATFRNAGRRMERKGSLNGAEIYDDYGHHPVEIRATLTAAKEMGYRRVICAYQPHTYSRTAGLWQSFVESLSIADRVFLVDIYAAREQNVYGVSSCLLAEGIGEKATYCETFSCLANALSSEACEGDLVIVMGAGDIFHTFDYLKLQ